jgi:uncharacterized membrane protein (UPF0127 family)
VLPVLLVVTLLRFYGPWNARTALTAGSHKYNLQVVKTVAAQEKGLGGRSNMPLEDGMLFVFQNETTRCFWMKDMHFPLDIIWTNKAHKVVYIQPELAPNTYPRSFCPSQPARYVIELNAGEAARSGIRVGETLTF